MTFQLGIPFLLCRLLFAASDHITAQLHDSGLSISHDSYNAITTASDGRIYYVLSTESLDTGAQMYCYDPATKQITHLGDLTEASGEKGMKAIPQGKSHVNFVEANGKLYFSTHVGYYTIKNGMETMGVPPQGYRPYPGGHFLSFDVKTHKYENLATARAGEGIITMNMDVKRGRIYGITWPTGIFIRYDLPTKSFKTLGPTADRGEAGKGSSYRTICRSLPVDPRDGSVYFTNSSGKIFRYRYDRDAIELVKGDDMVKDYLASTTHTRQEPWATTGVKQFGPKVIR